MDAASSASRGKAWPAARSASARAARSAKLRPGARVSAAAIAWVLAVCSSAPIRCYRLRTAPTVA